MKIGIIGCGYVFDHYMATLSNHSILELVAVTDIDKSRLKAVEQFYSVKTIESIQAILDDPDIKIIVNLTSIEAHYAIVKAALEAGKHVYSEKPLVTKLEQAKELFEIAERRGLTLSVAPCNALSPTSQTMWKAVTDGAVGVVRMVYAEFDDNPIYLMSPEAWRSRSGAPWPYLHEYESGCTWEHVGYHLTWMCAILGPVRSVTAFSKHILMDKTDEELNPPDTPDFSVAILDFESGVVGRVTCSIAAPYDHRMRIIGNKGMVHSNTYRDYVCPVYLETFTKLSMNARKAYSVRTSSFLLWLFGARGRRLPLARFKTKGSHDAIPGKGWGLKSILQNWKKRQLGQQDKFLGVVELAAAIQEQRPAFPPHDFTMHVTEITLAIQAAGPDGVSQVLSSRFEALNLPEVTSNSVPDYKLYTRRSFLDRLLAKRLDRMHGQ